MYHGPSGLEPALEWLDRHTSMMISISDEGCESFADIKGIVKGDFTTNTMWGTHLRKTLSYCTLVFCQVKRWNEVKV